MRFCMVTTFYPPYSYGGDGIFIHGLSNALARLGHRVDVIHCADSYVSPEPRGPLLSCQNHPNVTVHTLKSRAGLLSPFLTHQTGRPVLKARKLRQLIEGQNFDVIHYHNMSLIGITALQFGRAVKVYSLHEHWLVCPMHVLWRFNRQLCTQRRSCFLCALSGRRPPQLWRYTRLLEKMLRHVDVFICPTRFTAEKHKELGLDLPIVHLPYFLPESRQFRADTTAERKASMAPPYFLYLGRLEKHKGLHTLIPIFRSRGQHRLLVAGEGEYESKLRQATRGMPNVEFLGRLDHAEGQGLLRGALALTVPSVCYEVFPLVIVEAFAAGTPVIARRLGSLSEMLSGGGGLTYSEDDELVQCLDKLASDRDLRERLGEEACRVYSRQWTESAHVRRYLELIAELGMRKASGGQGTMTGGEGRPSAGRGGAQQRNTAATDVPGND